ncbi:hypothetical protein ACIPJS_29700 [Streptomyces sp. NPDC086783]
MLMPPRRLLTLDLPATVRESEERSPVLTDRAHGRSIQRYDT